MSDLLKLVKQRLRYDPKTGKCFWIKCPKRLQRFVGKEAGSPTQQRDEKRHGPPRWRIYINGRSYSRARIAFVLMSGKLVDIVDHINRNPMDDRWVNLRETNKSENGWNKKPYNKKSNLPQGVHLKYRRTPTSNKRYEARISASGRQFNLGCFANPEDAHKCYFLHKEKLHGEFLRRKK